MQMSQLSLMGIICERLRLKRQPKLMFLRWMVGSQQWFGTYDIPGHGYWPGGVLGIFLYILTLVY